MIDEMGHIKYDGFKRANIVSEIKAHVVLHARKKMYKLFMTLTNADSKCRILDAGVSPGRGISGQKTYTNNFFESAYPWTKNITATSIEDASYLELDYPGLTFVKCDPYKTPFLDREFDILFCNAVVEHTGNRDQQRAFVHEYCRVCKKFFFTTPNRWYPIEPHTALPFIHWLPSHMFRKLLTRIGKEALADESVLNLLDRREFLSLFPDDVRVVCKSIRTFGLISNICIYGEWIFDEDK